jgi:hypothetical protein
MVLEEEVHGGERQENWKRLSRRFSANWKRQSLTQRILGRELGSSQWMRGTYARICVCVMLQRGLGGMGLDKTFTSDGPGYFSIVIGYEGFMMWASEVGSGDQNRKTNDFVRNRDVFVSVSTNSYSDRN